ncbi:hypothetical protein [Serratia plymuthica]|uniref:hypothetical protein n=1 Tax=Serratia plymuthica TaxID=82996 RepID=UPI000937584C|nr:hypothetical protein [Serratia plymuthica]OJT46788.1 hypothetical protein BSR04_01690 [Serratia plymuthica]
MKVIDCSLLEYVSGERGNNGDDRTDNRGRSNRGSKSSNNSGSGNYCTQNTSKDGINGMGLGAATGAFSGLAGTTVRLVGDAVTGGCFNAGKSIFISR